jgi:hypothetical protein
MNSRRIFVRQIQQITLRDPLPRHLAPIDLLRARRSSLLASLVGVLAFTCAGVSAADTVRVTNPATEPVLTSRVDEPARVPYQVQLTGPSVIFCGVELSTVLCVGRINGVPAGKRLVVQGVSGALTASSPSSINGTIQVITTSPHAGYVAVASVSTVQSLIPPLNEVLYSSAFQSHETVYIDGGAPIYVNVSMFGSSSIIATTITVTGYVIDCTAAPCMPIVTQ